MTAGYLVSGKTKPFEYGQEFEANPKNLISTYAQINLRITINSPFPLQMITEQPGSNDEEIILCKYNLLDQKKKCTYTFQTKYSKDLDKVHSLDRFGLISHYFKEKYLRKPNKKLKKIALDLVGSEKECVNIMKKFHDFTYANVKGKTTSGKSLKRIVKQLSKKGFYHGNCKEVSTLYQGLCDCIGLPSRRIVGKHTAERGGHVWNEVLVPYEYDCIWIPDDAAMQYFNEFNQHIVHSYLPEAKKISARRLLSAMMGKNSLKIKVEQV